MQTNCPLQSQSALDHRWQVRRIAGAFRAGVKNGRALESLFHSPCCACMTANGDILVCTNTDRYIRVIRNHGLVESLPFCWLNPSGLCPTAQGIAVCDAGHHRIKFLSADCKKVTSVAGVGRKGFKDGPVATSEFNNPCSCCYDSGGALYVVDKGNHCIRKIKDGLVITVAGKGVPGHADGVLAMFNAPSDIVFHGSTGFLFIADTGNHCIRCIQPDLSGVLTVAGVPGHSGFQNGPRLDALFHSPSSLSLLNNAQSYGDKSNFEFMTNIVIAVADTLNNQIRRISFEKDCVDTLVGSVIPGTSDGNHLESKFHHPSWIRFTCSPGNINPSLIICDTENNVIREMFMSSEIVHSQPSVSKRTQDCLTSSQHPRDLRCSPHGSPLIPAETCASPMREIQKFDFSPRGGSLSKHLKHKEAHSFHAHIEVSCIYSGVAHLFKYQQGAYRYVSPCRIVVFPAASDFANPCLEFLEIPSDRVLSSCRLGLDVKFSVQNLTFVYFTRFGIGCRFGNKSDTDKFLELMSSFSLSLCDLDKSAQPRRSSSSMSDSPSNYAKQRRDRPYPLEVSLTSRAVEQETHKDLSGLCKNVALDIHAIYEDMLSFTSNKACQSGKLTCVQMRCWRKQLLNCSDQLDLSPLLDISPLRAPFDLNSSSSFQPSSSALNLKHLDVSGSNASFQVSWNLLRGDHEVVSNLHEQRSFFNVLSGEIIKLKMFFRGQNCQILRKVLVLSVPSHGEDQTALVDFDANKNCSSALLEIRVPQSHAMDACADFREFPMAVYALADQDSAISLDSLDIVLRLAMWPSQDIFNFQSTLQQSINHHGPSQTNSSTSGDAARFVEKCRVEVRALGSVSALNL